MEYFVGFALAVGVGIFGTLVGFDRERSFYSVVLIVVASYYILFAAMGGSPQSLATEFMPMGVFVIAAVAGFKGSPWFLVAGLAGHGVFDFLHASLIQNAGVPGWWPGFCLAYDVAAALFLAAILRFRNA